MPKDEQEHYNPVTGEKMTVEAWNRLQTYIKNAQTTRPGRGLEKWSFERSPLLPGEKRFRDRGLDFP